MVFRCSLIRNEQGRLLAANSDFTGEPFALGSTNRMHVFGHHDESKQPVLMPDHSTPAGFAEQPTMEIVVQEGQTPVAGERQFVDVARLVIMPHLFSMGPSHAVQSITAELAEPARDVRFKGQRMPSDFALPDKPDSGTRPSVSELADGATLRSHPATQPAHNGIVARFCGTMLSGLVEIRADSSPGKRLRGRSSSTCH